MDFPFCTHSHTDFGCIVHSNRFWEDMVPFPYRMEHCVFVHEAVPIFLVRVLRFRTYICLRKNLLSEGNVSIHQLYIQPHNLVKMCMFDNYREAVLSLELNETAEVDFALVLNKRKKILYRELRVAYTFPIGDTLIVHVV